MKEVELPQPKKYKLILTRDEYELLKKVFDEGQIGHYKKNEFPEGFTPTMIRIFSYDVFVDVPVELSEGVRETMMREAAKATTITHPR